jgi:hypothetical protein
VFGDSLTSDPQSWAVILREMLKMRRGADKISMTISAVAWGDDNPWFVRFGEIARAQPDWVRDISISSFHHSIPEIIEFEGKVSIMATTEGLEIAHNSIFDGIEIFVPDGKELVKEELTVTRMVMDLDAVELWGPRSDQELSTDATWDLAAKASTDDLPVVYA